MPVIMVVDDDPDAIRAIKIALVEANFHNPVIEARDGFEARDYLLSCTRCPNRVDLPRPDIILLDLKMPRMNGFEFLHWLRRWPPGNLIPVIVFTGSILDQDLHTAYQARANSFMTKGDDALELMQKVSAFAKIWLTTAVRLAYPHSEHR